MATLSPRLLKNKSKEQTPTLPPQYRVGTTEDFIYGQYTRTYSDEEIQEIYNKVNPPENRHNKSYKEKPTTFETEKTRNIIVKVIPKGTLLYTYFKPKEKPTNHDNIAKYLNTFACPNFSYNVETNNYEYCGSIREPAMKYFFAVPFASNGIDDWGKKYSNVVTCVTKRDIRVVYGKSGTDIDDLTISHKGNVVKDPKRVVECSEIKDACRYGLGDDFCLQPDFASEAHLDGFEHMSGQDTIMYYSQQINGYSASGRGTLRDLIKDFIQDIRAEETKSKPYNADRIQELESIIRESTIEIERLKEIAQPVSAKISLLSEELNRLDEKYRKTEENVNIELKERGVVQTNNDSYPNNWSWYKPYSSNDQLKRESIESEIATLQIQKREIDSQISGLNFKIYTLNEEKKYMSPQKHKDMLLKKNLLNLLLLQLDTDERNKILHYGFSEIVLNPIGWQSYTSEVFLPREDELYTVKAQDDIKQTLEIRPENLEAFLQKYIYPRNILQPISLINRHYQGPHPVCNPDTFPKLDAGQGCTFPCALNLYVMCMKYLLQTLKIDGNAPRIMYDLRTNLFQIAQFTSPITYQVPFYPGPAYNPQRDSYLSYPNNFMFLVDIAELDTDGIVQLSYSRINYATQLKVIKMIWATFIGNWGICNVYNLPNLNYNLMAGPFYQKPLHSTLSGKVNVTQQMNYVFKVLGDSEEIPITAMKHYFNSKDTLAIAYRISNKNWIGRYNVPIPEEETQNNAPNNTTPIASNNGLYAILGLAPGATVDEIKKAYKTKALEHHPNRGGDTKMFQVLQNAYEKLLKQNLTSNQKPLSVENRKEGGRRRAHIRHTKKKRQNRKLRRKTSKIHPRNALL